MTNVYLIDGFAQGLFDSDKAPKVDDLFQRPAKGTSILSAKAGGAVEREFGKKNLDTDSWHWPTKRGNQPKVGK
jgi:hypothetical protein